MPRRRLVPCCTEKTVLVAVYVEKPRTSRRFSSNHHHNHDQHNHELHHALIKRQVIQHKIGGSYDRRAELLGYSQRLRDSAKHQKLKAKPVSPNNHQPALPGKRKHKDLRIPDCLSNWKLLNPRFLRTFAGRQQKRERKRRKPTGFTTDKIKSVVKSFEVRKNFGFVSKLLSKLQKRK